MGFYYRIFGKKCISFDKNELEDFLNLNNIPFSVELGTSDDLEEEEDEFEEDEIEDLEEDDIDEFGENDEVDESEDFEEAEDLDDEEGESVSEDSFILYDSDNNPVAVLERDTLGNSDLLELELGEFQKVVSNMLPAVNQKWASDFLKNVQICFAFEIKKSGLKEENWEYLAMIAEMLRSATDGIEQSDGGQITNEFGDIILAVPESEEDAEDDQFEEDWCSCTAALWKNSDWNTFRIDNKESFHHFLNGDHE